MMEKSRETKFFGMEYGTSRYGSTASKDFNNNNKNNTYFLRNVEKQPVCTQKNSFLDFP